MEESRIRDAPKAVRAEVRNAIDFQHGRLHQKLSLKKSF